MLLKLGTWSSELLGNHRFANGQWDWTSYEPKNMPPNGGVLDLKWKQNHIQYCLNIVVKFVLRKETSIEISTTQINFPTRIGVVLIPPEWFWASKSYI